MPSFCSREEITVVATLPEKMAARERRGLISSHEM
jgi:hypothetical protein